MQLPKSFFIALIVLFGLGVASASYAYMEHDDITGRWGVGLDFSVVAPTSNESDPGFRTNVNFTYGIWDHIAGTIDVGYFETNYDAFGIEFGDLGVVPLIFSFQWRYPYMFGQIPATVYGVTGLGGLFLDFDEANSPLTSAVDPDDAFAIKLGVGFDFFVDYNWVVNVEGSYTFSDEHVILTNADGSQSTSEDLDFWNLGAGMKYFW